MILGNLGADPEIRYTQSQLAICSLRMATNERRKNSDGEWQDETEWHRVTVFGKQAENCAQYLKKGRQAFVEGRIKTNKWQDKEGNDRYTTEILANNVQFIGGRAGDSSGGYQSGGNQFSGGSQAGGQAPSGNPSSGNSAPSGAGQIESVPFDDDDIPF